MMKTEKQKMLSGELYNSFDEELMKDRVKARLLLKQLNDSREDEVVKRDGILNELLPQAGDNLWIQPPFYCDYGTNIITGEGVFFNFNCVVLDVMEVNIGSKTMFGPNVQIYTATHPLDYKIRNTGLEYAKPITIGENVWVGGSVVICPGITIGDNSIIGACLLYTSPSPRDRG